MGNMCFEHCKDVLRCKRKNRLIKEIHDIHPTHEGTLRQDSTAKDDAVSLDYGQRLFNGDVVYICRSDRSEDVSVTSDVERLLLDVSIEDDDDDDDVEPLKRMSVSVSTSSIQLSCLLGELERRRYNRLWNSDESDDATSERDVTRGSPTLLVRSSSSISHRRTASKMGRTSSYRSSSRRYRSDEPKVDDHNQNPVEQVLEIFQLDVISNESTILYD